MIGTFGIEGARSAVADGGAGRGKEPIGGVNTLQQGQGRGLGLRRKMRG